MLGARKAGFDIPELKGKGYFLPDFDKAYDFVSRCWDRGFKANWTPWAGDSFYVQIWR